MQFLRTSWLVVAAAVSFALFTAPALAQRPPEDKAPKATKVRGHIVRLDGKDRFVIRTPEKKEVILLVNDRTRYLLENRAVRFADLREDAEVEVVYDVVDRQYHANAVTILPVAGPDTFVEGEIIKVVEPEGHFIVRVKGGREVIVYADPQTAFTLGDRTVHLADIQSGMLVKAKVNLRDKRHHAHSVVLTPRNPK